MRVTIFFGFRDDNGYFSVIPPPPPHQNIRKAVEIVPEKMKKSSIEILQILVLSKYKRLHIQLAPHPSASFRMEMCMPGAKVFPSLTIKQSGFFFPSEWKCACQVQRFFLPLQLNNQPFSFLQN